MVRRRDADSAAPAVASTPPTAAAGGGTSSNTAQPSSTDSGAIRYITAEARAAVPRASAAAHSTKPRAVGPTPR